MKNIRWLILSVVVILLDQASKQYVIHALLYQRPMPIFSWLNFTLNYNTGAAFSMFANTGGWHRWFLSALAFIVSGLLFIWIIQTESHKKGTLIAFALIFGGAVSNLIDRLVFGYVIDFIDFHLGSWHFATFNIADSAITLGAILLGILLILKRA